MDFDYDEFEKYNEYDEEMEEEYEYEDEEAEGETRVRPKKTAKKRVSRRSIFEMYEPSELESSHLTDQDNEIRMTDMPERFQVRKEGAGLQAENILAPSEHNRPGSCRPAGWILAFLFPSWKIPPFKGIDWNSTCKHNTVTCCSCVSLVLALVTISLWPLGASVALLGVVQGLCSAVGVGGTETS